MSLAGNAKRQHRKQDAGCAELIRSVAKSLELETRVLIEWLAGLRVFVFASSEDACT